MPAQNCLRHLSTGACVWAFTVVILLLARAMNVAGCRPGSRDGIRWTYREFVANCKLIYIYICIWIMDTRDRIDQPDVLRILPTTEQCSVM